MVFVSINDHPTCLAIFNHIFVSKNHILLLFSFFFFFWYFLKSSYSENNIVIFCSMIIHFAAGLELKCFKENAHITSLFPSGPGSWSFPKTKNKHHVFTSLGESPGFIIVKVRVPSLTSAWRVRMSQHSTASIERVKVPVICNTNKLTLIYSFKSDLSQKEHWTIFKRNVILIITP